MYQLQIRFNCLQSRKISEKVASRGNCFSLVFQHTKIILHLLLHHRVIIFHLLLNHIRIVLQ